MTELCPDPNWPAGKDGANSDCWVGSARSTMSDDGATEAFLQLQDNSAALCNVRAGAVGWLVRLAALA